MTSGRSSAETHRFAWVGDAIVPLCADGSAADTVAPLCGRQERQRDLAEQQRREEERRAMREKQKAVIIEQIAENQEHRILRAEKKNQVCRRLVKSSSGTIVFLSLCTYTGGDVTGRDMCVWRRPWTSHYRLVSAQMCSCFHLVIASNKVALKPHSHLVESANMSAGRRYKSVRRLSIHTYLGRLIRTFFQV